MPRPCRTRLLATLGLVALACASAVAAAADAPSGTAPVNAPVAVKVLIVNMFGLEAAPWLAALEPDRDIRIAGLLPDYPAVRCTARGVCQMTTGMGHANAAASMMAVLFSGALDLRQAYFVVAGIGGIDPARGTIGSAAWARFAVDAGIAHEIDARELPAGWQDGYFGVLTDGPGQVPRFDYGTEAFQLDESLLQRAIELSAAVVLQDSDDVARYRSHYVAAPAARPPAVVQCDTLSGDTWWGGARLGDHAHRWTELLTHGKGVYCTTQQEDNATLNVLTRAARAGLIDLHRVAVLRTGSDFDRPYRGQSAIDSMLEQRKLAGALRISTDNLVRAGMPLVEAIVGHWEQWRAGVPAAVGR